MKRLSNELIQYLGRFWLSGYFKLEDQDTDVTNLTPSTGYLHLYAKLSSGVAKLFYKTSGGTEVGPLIDSTSVPVTSVFGRVGAVVAALNDYTWAQINKATSSLADITTRLHSDLQSIGTDDHHAKSHAHSGADGSGTVAHSALTGTTTDDHHNKSHAHDGADGSGTVAHSALTGATTDDHHAKSHTHNADGSGNVDHGSLTGLADDDHSAYLLASAATDRATFATNWTDLTDGGATTLHTHSGGSGHTIRENGTDQATRTGLNFIDADAGVGLVTDDAGNNETEVNLGLYRLESQDHSHQSTGAQAGQLDHGAALTGLSDDDHTQYLLVAGTRAMTGALDMGGFDITNIEDLSMDSDGVARMESQNRFRFLNSMARAVRTTTQTISNATFTLIAWDSENFDTDTLHDNSTNNSRITIKLAGKYFVACYVTWNLSTASNSRFMAVQKNAGGTWGAGTTLFSDARTVIAGFGLANSNFTVAEFAVNDYVEAFVYQNSGANDTIKQTPDSWLFVAYLGE